MGLLILPETSGYLSAHRPVDVMYKNRTIGVVVPAYNEKGLVSDVIETLPGFVDRIYVVDDCSTDGTWQEIRETIQEENPEDPRGKKKKIHGDGGQLLADRAVSIRHDQNRGVGAAIKTGYRRAREDGIDVTAVVNGDGQMDPTILHRIIDPVVEGNVDYAKGNRLSRSEHRKQMSAWRLFGNSILSFLTKVSSGYWQISDPQNGYTAISSHALAVVDIDSLHDDYGFLNDLLVALNVHAMRVTDVWMESKYGDEESHIRYSRFIPMLSGLLVHRMLWRFKTKYVVMEFHPLILLYALGSIGICGGLTYAGWVALASTPTPLDGMLSLLTLLISGLCITLAMIFDRSNSKPLERNVNKRVPDIER